MNDDRFELETDQIEKFTENGIKTSGKNHELDLIIMATGFKLCESTYTIAVVIKLYYLGSNLDATMFFLI